MLLIDGQIRVVEEPSQWGKSFDENARIQPACRRDSDQPRRKLLTPYICAVGGGTVLVKAVDDFRNLLFHEPTALFDDKYAADLPREFCNQLGIDRIADAKFKDRHLVCDAEFRQCVFQVTVSKAR